MSFVFLPSNDVTSLSDYHFGDQLVWPSGRSETVMPPETRKRESSHLDIENPIYDGKLPHLWIQWKGTDVCCDIQCRCGAHLHFDGDFLYFFQCPHCLTYWECGTHVPIYEVTKERAGEFVKQPQRDARMPLAGGGDGDA